MIIKYINKYNLKIKINQYTSFLFFTILILLISSFKYLTETKIEIFLILSLISIIETIFFVKYKNQEYTYFLLIYLAIITFFLSKYLEFFIPIFPKTSFFFGNFVIFSYAFLFPNMLFAFIISYYKKSKENKNNKN